MKRKDTVKAKRVVQAHARAMTESTRAVTSHHARLETLLEISPVVLAGAYGAREAMSTPRIKIGESLTGTVAAPGEPLGVWDHATDPMPGMLLSAREAPRLAPSRPRWCLTLDLPDRTDPPRSPQIRPGSASSDTGPPTTRPDSARGDDREGVFRLENGTRQLRVLVVEDEPLVCKMVCDVLRFMGHHASGGAGGAEGVELFERDRHDLVITDLRMPGLSGWDVIERLRRTDQAVPVIIITGAATSEDMERARAGGIRLLQKPLHIRDLEAAIRALPSM